MSFPFDHFIVDEKADPNTVYLYGVRYKFTPVGNRKPPTFRTEIDWDATAKASAVITNIGEGK